MLACLFHFELIDSAERPIVELFLFTNKDRRIYRRLLSLSVLCRAAKLTQELCDCKNSQHSLIGFPICLRWNVSYNQSHIHQCMARNVYAPAGGTALVALTLQKWNDTVFAELV